MGGFETGCNLLIFGAPRIIPPGTPQLGGVRPARNRVTWKPSMETTTQPVPELFEPNPHLSDRVNSNLVQSEIEGGVDLREVAPGTVLEIETENRAYTIRYQGLGQALISGHP